jgi:hypothetical protein
VHGGPHIENRPAIQVPLRQWHVLFCAVPFLGVEKDALLKKLRCKIADFILKKIKLEFYGRLNFRLEPKPFVCS